MLKAQFKIVINDNLINYYQSGSDKNITLIFLHGWRSSALVWYPIMNKLSKSDTKTFAIDLPGFGESPTPKKAFFVVTYANAIAGFIEKLKLDKVIVVGHSLGGRIAIKLSATRPDLISKVVLVDSAGLILNKYKLENRKKIAHLAKPFFKPKFMHGIRDRIYQSIGSEDYVSTPELKETLINVLNEDLEPYLSKINKPTLLIWGEDDTETPLSTGKIMHEKIKKSKLIVLKNAGHYSFIDQPNEFLSALNGFIKK